MQSSVLQAGSLEIRGGENRASQISERVICASQVGREQDSPTEERIPGTDAGQDGFPQIRPVQKRMTKQCPRQVRPAEERTGEPSPPKVCAG